MTFLSCLPQSGEGPQVDFEEIEVSVALAARGEEIGDAIAFAANPTDQRIAMSTEQGAGRSKVCSCGRAPLKNVLRRLAGIGPFLKTEACPLCVDDGLEGVAEAEGGRDLRSVEHARATERRYRGFAEGNYRLDVAIGNSPPAPAFLERHG
jgi:hypothetical protein